MTRIVLRHTKQLSELKLKRATTAFRRPDPQEGLRERVQQLQRFEKKFGMSSVAFYQKYRAGKMGDSASVMRWAATYEAYLSLVQAVSFPQAQAR